MVSSSKPVIVLFADGKFLEFDSEKEANGFLGSYKKKKTASTRKPGRLYRFEDGKWL
jgi:hypothetical protein